MKNSRFNLLSLLISFTFLFFSIAFYGTGINWITLGIGDFTVKVLMALTMLIPFRILMASLKDFSKDSIKPSSI